MIHPDRLYILETDRKTVTNSFEWCAPGIKPELETLQHLDYQDYIGGWEKFLEKSSCVLIEDIEMLKADAPIDYENLKRQGINRCWRRLSTTKASWWATWERTIMRSMTC